MAEPRYLTKSRFKLGYECPTKLFYTKKRHEYADIKNDNAFLLALAEAGNIVGALATLYFPGGIEIEELDHETALSKTRELMQRDEVTIFEAAVCFNNLFIRIDVLIKKGNQLELIEVKSKSLDTRHGDPFRNQNGTIKSGMEPYLMDVGFQRHVLTRAFPECQVDSYLMGTDPQASCTVNGLYQMFDVEISATGRKTVNLCEATGPDTIGDPILTKVQVDEHIDQLENQEFHGHSFEGLIQWLSDHYERDDKISPTLGKKCKGCEFRNNSETNLKDGFRECWQEVLGWQDEDFDQPLVYDLASFQRSDQLIEGGVYRLCDIEAEQLNITITEAPGLSQSERQWLQVECAKNLRQQSFLDKDGLAAEMNQWRYPLHFIDFETASPVVPLHQDLYVNENLAFQFSHHTVDENGAITHASQYLNDEVGQFPNFEFIRELKTCLEGNEGTIFRYTSHENTVLNHILGQLDRLGRDLDDYQELRDFACHITQPRRGDQTRGPGDRNMVDLYRLLRKYYYHPDMGGSNSLKDVLPAILNDSEYLQTKYSAPIYGAADGIASCNFEKMRWVQYQAGQIMDPYSHLKPLFEGNLADLDERWRHLEDLQYVKEGTAAMTAYYKLQREDLPGEFRQRIRTALLEYCELDTFAMVMLYEGWRAACDAENGVAN